MKKLLALVLTLVMTMSLMTVSNAATFSDDANIDYKEAVEVMAAVGVLAGDGTGAFDADGELTRAAAAKIVTYLMIGADAAEGLVGSAVFTDVPADHWAAGYIGYLVSEGVVAGVGDGKFDPNGKVTALQFAKMLLVALGYDASDWAIAASKLAYGKKLFKGNDSIKVNSVATRQEAALYAFNALRLSMSSTPPRAPPSSSVMPLSLPALPPLRTTPTATISMRSSTTLTSARSPLLATATATPLPSGTTRARSSASSLPSPSLPSPPSSTPTS